MNYKVFCFADDFFICAKTLRKAIRYVRREMNEEWAFTDFKKVDLENTKINIRVCSQGAEDELYYQNMNIKEGEEVCSTVDDEYGYYVWDGFDWYERISLNQYLQEKLKKAHNREFLICEENWSNIGLVPVK